MLSRSLVGSVVALTLAGCGGGPSGAGGQGAAASSPANVHVAATQLTARPSASRTRARHRTTAHPPPKSHHHSHRFQPVSVTATSAADWWVLGARWAGARHRDSIEHTIDGGRSFTRITIPTAARPRHDHSVDVRFADPSDGYLFGSHLFVTHDGGRDWHAVDLGGPVLDLAASAGRVYALVGHGRRRLLYVSAVGSDHWSRLPAPRDLLGGLWVQGTHLFAQNQRLPRGDIGKHLLVSLDGGQHWHRDAVPSPGLGCDVDQVRPPVLWERCNTGMMSGVWRSTNEGRTFSQNGREGEDSAINAATFAAADNRTAVYGYFRLERTTDAGRHFVPVGPVHHTWDYVGFTDPSHGLAIATRGRNGGGPTQLWASHDAGRRWHRVPIH